MPTGEYENPFVTPENFDGEFVLTERQRTLFEAYAKDLKFDVNVFENADPIDVAQVFIECGVVGYWLGEYNLFNFEGADSPLTKTEAQKQSEADIAKLPLQSRRDQANIVFAYLNNGKFTDNGDGSGFIEYPEINVEDGTVGTRKINLRQNEKGIWLISYDIFS
jgi:hypothetical protein